MTTDLNFADGANSYIGWEDDRSGICSTNLFETLGNIYRLMLAVLMSDMLMSGSAIVRQCLSLEVLTSRYLHFQC